MQLECLKQEDKFNVTTKTEKRAVIKNQNITDWIENEILIKKFKLSTTAPDIQTLMVKRQHHKFLFPINRRRKQRQRETPENIRIQYIFYEEITQRWFCRRK